MKQHATVIPLKNLLILAAKSLSSRRWYSLSQVLLLALCLSSAYLMSTLSLLIPRQWVGAFGFFTRGGLEASTDLLILGSVSLLCALFIIAGLTLRLQVRLSWMANHDKYRLLMQIGLSNSELRHLLRLEGLILFIVAMPLSVILSQIMMRMLVREWTLADLLVDLSHFDSRSTFFTLSISLLLLEFSRSNFVRKLTFKPNDMSKPNPFVCQKKKQISRISQADNNSKKVRQLIKKQAWTQTPFTYFADLGTLTVSFALMFFIFSIKAGSLQPQLDQVAPDVSYDLQAQNTNRRSLHEDIRELSATLPSALENKSDAVYLYENAELTVAVPIDMVDENYRELRLAEGYTDVIENNSLQLDFQLYPLSRDDYNSLFEIPAIVSSYTGTAPLTGQTHSPSFDEWKRGNGAIVIQDIEYAAPGKILSNNLQITDLVTNEYYAVSMGDRIRLPDVLVTGSIENLPWFVNPVSQQMKAILLISDELYDELFGEKVGGWTVRLRIDENIQISFDTHVNQEWSSSQSDLTIQNHYGRRREQARINHTLNLLFNISLFFVIQFILIQLTVFIQGQYFIREDELTLFNRIGLFWKQERSIVNDYCLRLFVQAIIYSLVITILISLFWNRFIQPITALTIDWPIGPAVLLITGFSIAVTCLTRFRIKQTDIH